MRRLEGFSVVTMAAFSLAIVPGAWGNFIIDFDDGLTNGTIEMFEPVTGVPTNGISFIDPGANDITLVFQVTMNIGSHELSEFGIGITTEAFVPVLSTGLGWIPNAGESWSDISGFDGPSDTRIFMFDPVGGQGGNGNGVLDPGETSDLFFVSYAEGSLEDGMPINFMITNGGPTFTVSHTIKVPAPGALALLLIGAAGAGSRRRRT